MIILVLSCYHCLLFLIPAIWCIAVHLSETLKNNNSNTNLKYCITFLNKYCFRFQKLANVVWHGTLSVMFYEMCDCHIIRRAKLS